MTTPILTPEELKRIRKVQLKMDHIATDILAGMYRSAFKGRGMEFEEVREFQTGDEVRSVDWNVTARMGTPYVKLFREERELTVILMIDISASTKFGSKSALKSDILHEIGAVLAFSGIKNQDKIGLILFSDHVEHYLPPAKGVRHVLRLIRDIMAFPAQGKKTNLESALRFLGKVHRKRCVVFLFSDFLDDSKWENEMAVIANTHDLIAISITDPREKEIPKAGLIRFMDLESGREMLVDTTSKAINQLLSNSHDLSLTRAKKTIETNHGTFVQLSTDRPWLIDLKKFFLSRVKKR